MRRLFASAANSLGASLHDCSSCVQCLPLPYEINVTARKFGIARLPGQVACGAASKKGSPPGAGGILPVDIERLTSKILMVIPPEYRMGIAIFHYNKFYTL